jgi:hypothetical protein
MEGSVPACSWTGNAPHEEVHDTARVDCIASSGVYVVIELILEVWRTAAL